jgi:hypothetical protein
MDEIRECKVKSDDIVSPGNGNIIVDFAVMQDVYHDTHVGSHTINEDENGSVEHVCNRVHNRILHAVLQEYVNHVPSNVNNYESNVVSDRAITGNVTARMIHSIVSSDSINDSFLALPDLDQDSP